MENFCTYIYKTAYTSPDKIFFCDSTEKFTYKDFTQKIHQTIHFCLSISSTWSQKKVVLLIDNSIDLLSTFFALIHLGANPILANPKDIFHAKKTLHTKNYHFIFYDQNILDVLSTDSIAFCTQKIRSADAQKSIPEICTVKENDIMFSLYTSGTSGQPKYIEKSYSNIITELHFLQQKLKITRDHTVLTIVPHVHIYGLLFGVLLPLKVGANIVESSKFLPSHIIKTIQHQQAHFLIACPVHYESLLKVIDTSTCQHLQVCISSGAPLSEKTALDFYNIVQKPIIELYGSTETGGIAYRCIEKDYPNLQLFPYIKMSIDVLEDECEAKEGELIINSPAISPNMAKDAYATGDYIRLYSDNSFSIIGRQQHLIKFGGKRIFAMQLEEELKMLEQITEAAVVRISENSIRGERAVAFVTTNVSMSSDDIKKRLQASSNNANVISKIFLQKSIPRNHNNKVDYAKLHKKAQCFNSAQDEKIGVIIPTFNHGYLLGKIIDDCREYVKEIIVVVDGSTDDTLSKLQNYDVHKVIFQQNQGKGKALKAGFCKAHELGWNYAITIDSDGQHHAHHLPDFVTKIQSAPGSIIVGDRDMSAEHIPGSSKFGKNFTNFWLKIETGLDVKDGQSGFRLYPIQKINKIKTYFTRYEFEVEILARAAWHKIPITSIPISVEYNPKGGRVSHFRPFIDNTRTSILNTILVIIRVFHLLKLVRFKKA